MADSLLDQNVGMYRNSIRSKKWPPPPLFAYLIDVAINNAWNRYTTSERRCHLQMDQLLCVRKSWTIHPLQQRREQFEWCSKKWIWTPPWFKALESILKQWRYRQCGGTAYLTCPSYDVPLHKKCSAVFRT